MKALGMLNWMKKYGLREKPPRKQLSCAHGPKPPERKLWEFPRGQGQEHDLKSRSCAPTPWKCNGPELVTGCCSPQNLDFGSLENVLIPRSYTNANLREAWSRVQLNLTHKIGSKRWIHEKAINSFVFLLRPRKTEPFSSCDSLNPCLCFP